MAKRINSRLKRQLEGKANREKMKGLKLEVTVEKSTETSRPPSTNKKELNSFLQKVKVILDQDSTKKSRIRKDKRIQAVILSADEIFTEVSHSLSPFMYPEDPGSTERKRIAKIIAKDLWNIYKTKVNIGTVYIQGQEDAFVRDPNPAALFDNTTMVMYVHGKKGTSHFGRLSKTVNPALKRYLRTKPSSDPTRVFFLPDDEYYEEKKALEGQLEKDYQASSGLISSRAPSKTPEAAKKQWKINQRSKRQGFKDLRAKYPGNRGGAVLGHTFGPGVSVGSAGLLDDKTIVSQQDINDVELSSVIPAELRTTLKPLFIELVSEGDAKLIYERTVRANNVIGEIAIIAPELALKNSREGTDAQKTLKKIKIEIRKYERKIINMGGSPSFVRLIREYIESIFLGVKPKNKKYTTRKTIKKGGKTVLPVTVNTIKGGTARVRDVGGSSSGSAGTDLNSTIGLINRKLHDQIQKNMGKGRSKKILNYRTGDFARSAEVQTFFDAHEKNAIGARVKYQRQPYGVYEPGNYPPLYKPGRSPARIFGISIRQILQEEQIVKLRRVKVELSG